MGTPMAVNLCKAGYPLWVYARRKESMQPLLDIGATACSSLRELAHQVEVIILIVSDTPDVEHLVLGEIMLHALPGSVVVDMSTISPIATRAIAKTLHARSIEMLDAPVSGGEVGAINATLSIMVGGKASVFARIKPLFEVLGKNIVHVGKHGAGQVAKACNQIVAGMTIQAIAEALTFASKSGVDPAKVREALMGGFAASKILEVHGKRMLNEDFKPGFKAQLHQKDIAIVMQTAKELGITLLGATHLMDSLNAVVDAGYGEMDSSAIIKVIAQMNQAPDVVPPT